ncbi:MAG: acylphosphatase [Verrucomicrobiales bacterium]|nr:acylphosphatase [Verrucomicrobiales bacterium]|tara:strand:- start:895 stop:1173 length:279 start_codon:yes stop_codon:yes gene_type:complete
MSLVRVNVHYSGRVQGVGFRYIVKSLVPGYEVLGTVKNLSDGRVEMVVEGQQEELEEFLQAIRDSGLRSNIQDESLVWGEAEDKFRGFKIIG